MNNTFKDRILRAFTSTNFIATLFILLGGLYVAFPENLAREIVFGGAALIAAGFGLRDFLKKGTIDVAAWASNPNTWAYLGTIIAYLAPRFPVEILNSGDNIVDAINRRDLNALLLIILPLLTQIYHLITGGKTAKV